jgi:drug/metabolite transporter (DMT)-like permease
MTAPSASLLSPRVLLPFALVTLIWGSTWIVIKGQLGIVPPSWSVTYRFAVAAAAMFAFAVVRRERLTPGPRALARNSPSTSISSTAPSSISRRGWWRCCSRC